MAMFPCARSSFYEDQLRPWHDHFDELRDIARETDDLRDPSVSSRSDRFVSKRDSDKTKATYINDDEKFKISFDVEKFNPEDLEVKVRNNILTVFGRREVRRDAHSFTKRQLTCSFILPDGVAPENLKSSISPDGVRDFFDELGRMSRHVENLSRAMLAPFAYDEVPRVAGEECGVSSVVNDDKKFQVSLDVKQFKPEELDVTTKDNQLIIHGKHEEKKDEHGFVKREFTRAYWLPQGIKPESFKSNLSPEGVLTIEAPKINRMARHVENLSRAMRVPFTYDEMPRTVSAERGVSSVVNDEKKFQVSLDVKHFKPEELEHEENKDEHGFVKREFTRAYWLPQGIKPETFKSNLSPEGVLTIEAPKAAAVKASEHKIPIKY
ncbi:HSP20 domain containing protein [Trichuris trichiura]|uniref:HSP20 domain containing protein n=1 Tax=Trichuris trichiura TaxID=36087 RepID=A0A077Z9T3_TRITR|nr:HSP20 domain containing protein [Trichuris trichiura]